MASDKKVRLGLISDFFGAGRYCKPIGQIAHPRFKVPREKLGLVISLKNSCSDILASLPQRRRLEMDVKRGVHG